MAIVGINSKKKSPGEDGITSETLTARLQTIPEPYLHIIQSVLKAGLLSEEMEKGQGNTNHEA